MDVDVHLVKFRTSLDVGGRGRPCRCVDAPDTGHAQALRTHHSLEGQREQPTRTA